MEALSSVIIKQNGGAAIDIRTTTLVAALIDLNTGQEIAAVSSLNPQIQFGHEDQVLIAGAFGFHLRAKNLVRIGILPCEMEAKIDLAGNTSKTGDRPLLPDRFLRGKRSE
jgi:uncharacterized 2Fe-2S/4Fe-4S cluster protein (DUF4445 family)